MDECGDPTLHELPLGNDGKLRLDFIPGFDSELLVLDVALAARLAVDDVDRALAHLLERVALQALLAKVATVELAIDDALHQHIRLGLLHAGNEVELGVGLQLDRHTVLVARSVGVRAGDDLPDKAPLLPHQGANLGECVHHVVLHLPLATPRFQLLSFGRSGGRSNLALLQDLPVKAHPRIVHLLDLVREVQFQLELALLVVDVAEQEQHLEVLVGARADHHFQTLGEHLVLLAVRVGFGQPLNGFTGVVTSGAAEVAGEQGLHERGARHKKVLPLLVGRSAPSLPEFLVEGHDADALAVRAVLLLERIDELKDVGLVEITRGVGLLGGFQEVGRKIEDEAQRMLLPPRFDHATFLGMLGQGGGVSKRS